MDLSYSAEQKAFVESFSSYCQKEVAVHAAEVDQTAAFPKKSFDALVKFGYLGMPIPEAYGGQAESSDAVTRCLAQEIVAKSCPATFFVCGASNGLFAAPVTLFATDEQKKRFLPGIANGTKLGAMALTEPHAGSDAAAIRTRAVKKGDRWFLTGTKTFITNAPVADYILIHAVSDPSAGPLGVTSFIAERGTPGLEIGPPMKKMGMKGSQTAELFLQECEVPDANVLGQPGQGFLLAMQTLEWGRVGIANFCVGIAQACLEDSVEYASTRTAFGRPIATFGDVRTMIAQMALSIETARRMAQRVAWTKEKVGPCPAEASAAKLYASETGMRSAHAAVQIHGGMGYIAETRVERLFRDIRIAEIGEGTSEIQRHILAKDVFER